MTLGGPLNKIRFDNTSGSSAILDQLINVLKDPDTENSWQDNVGEVLTFGFEELQQFQVVQHFINELKSQFQYFKSYQDLSLWIKDYQSKWADLADKWAGSLAEILEGTSLSIATHSQSETVKAVIYTLANSGFTLKVFQTQSAPANEGELQANWLANKGIDVVLTTEALFTRLVEKSDLVLLGCDGVYSNGFVNKAGSYAICLAAAAFDKPVYILADSRKISDKPASPEKIKPSGEVSIRTHPNLEVINYYFELVPHHLVSGYISESGVLEENKTV